MNSIILKLIVLLVLSSRIVVSQTPTYMNPLASIDDRVDDLLSRMTLDEKIGQMTQADHKAVSNLHDVTTYFLGSILSGGDSDPDNGNSALDWTNLYDSFQQKAMATRLKIPIIYGIDAVHGHSNVTGATIFPHNIGLGATRNPELVKQVSRATAIEIAATGIDWTFAPCIAVPRDERWGRTYEGFGETPELAEMFAWPAITGLQNDSLNNPTSIVACAKHFVGDGGTTNGDDQGNTEISEQELRAIHLPGYISAIESNVKTIMASYNSWNGIKLHGSKFLLTDLLKTELGFDGFIISDWAAIDQIPGDYKSDVEISINAGVDMVMVPNDYVNFFTTLKGLVQQGKVSEERINDAVIRILKVKFELGLFEKPYADRTLLIKVGSEEHRSIAKQSVSESLVLLKKNEDVLPLPKTNSKILVAGEHADNIGLQCGGWTIQWGGASGNITTGTTILEGLRKTSPSSEFVYDANGNFNNIEADYAIVVIGEQPYAEGGGDRDDLTLERDHVSLVRKMNNLGLPVITILISGRPMIINPALHFSDVFIAAWLPGTEADGIAEVIFGDKAPKGLLPMTWSKSMNQIPLNFGDANYTPLFPYGFGITSLENSVSTSAPTLQTGLVTECGGYIELEFNKSMSNASNTEADLSVMKNGSTSVAVVNFELSTFDDNIIILELNEKVKKGDILTISYLSGNISSKDGVKLEPFESVELINYLDYISGSNSIPGKIEAEDYTNMSGIQTEGTSDIGGGDNIGWIDDNDWMEYTCDIEYTGVYQISYRVASESSGGTLNVYSNNGLIGTQTIPVTGGWQNWQTVSSIIDLESGESIIKLLASKGGFNLNWFSLNILTDINSENNQISNYTLNQNYPNPFNPTTVIKYGLAENSFAKIEIFNVLGQKVAVLANENKSAGNHQTIWDAQNLPSGIYFISIDAKSLNSNKNFKQVKKALLVR